jgi:hypothetical protein
MQVNVVMYSSLQDSISMCAYGKEVGIPYYLVKQQIPNIFPVDDIFQINYEAERGIFNVMRIDAQGERHDSGEDVPEIVWIRENFDLLFQTCKKFTDDLNKDTIGQRRSSLLFETDYIILRHTEQLTLGIDTTLTEEQYQSLLTYRQWLRDMGETVEDMNAPFDTVTWMESPL